MRAPVEPAEPESIEGDVDPILTALAGGVPTHTLRKIFRLDYETTRDRVRPLKPMRVGRGGAKLYDLADAASYLVKPKIDLEAYLKTLKQADLPRRLQASWWEAKLKRQKFEKNAGDLWPGAAVLEKFAAAFKLIRVTTQLWVDELEATSLNVEQRELLTRLVDSLLADVYRILVEDAKKTQTFSQLAELDEDADEVEE